MCWTTMLGCQGMLRPPVQPSRRCAQALKPHCLQGLRLHDNHALDRAQKDVKTLFPVFCLDPWFIESGNVGPNRINFLLQSLTDLDGSLKKIGSRLIVLRGKPLEVLPAVAQAWNIGKLCFERDTEPYAIERDTAMSKTFKEKGVEVWRPPCAHAVTAKPQQHA